jgi:flagellar biogenesis protein FliO
VNSTIKCATRARAGTIILMLLVSVPALAQTTRPSTAPTTAAAATAIHPGRFEQTPLRHGDSPADASAVTSEPKPLHGVEPKRVVLAVVIVVALILILRWIGLRFFPAAAAARSSSAIRVLSRSIVAPKQQVLLLQVGRRVVVVGDCGVSMHPLTEITDPEEVAALIGQIDAEKPESLTHAFGNLFGSARKEFDEAAHEARDEAEHEHESTEDEDPQLELAGAGAAISDQGEVDEPVTSARSELRGLMDKVKLLSRQFHP